MIIGQIPLPPHYQKMKLRLTFCKVCLIVVFGLVIIPCRAQFLVDMIDTAARVDKGLWAIYKKSDHLLISGYFQPQFQATQTKGAENYSGGNFSKYSDNRFMLRRARIRFDYAHFTEDGLPQAQVVFQFDGSERGVVIRDFWGRFYENKWQLFSLTTGMFARPFGYEVNVSSGDRETPERGRMSQILMRTERDLGAMVSLEPRKKQNPFRLLKFDIGLFNGQGLTAPEEYDSYKDIISRFSLKSYPLSNKVSVSGGLSLMEGGLVQNTKFIYKMSESNGSKAFVVDSSANNIGGKAPRKYRGFDGQIKIKNSWGLTQLRGEYWWGKQSASADESNTPGALLTGPYYIRDFNGAFFYLLQNIVTDKHQVILKYDFYDPNIKVKGDEIGKVQDTHKADIRYNTFGFGYTYYFNKHIKILAWYDIIKNEATSLNGYTADVRDNVFTLRTQFKF